VTLSLSARRIQAIVLDIEGTTTPIDFVYTVLFPYARAHAEAYVRREEQSPACASALKRIRAEQAEDRARGLRPPESMMDYVGWLMDQDRKSPGLKALQGLIFQEGFATGELRGQVYPDVAPALERWRAHGLDIYIYSSGSALAQRLLFESTAAGDLTVYLKGYFDTAIGPKTAVQSYRTIAERLEVAPPAIVFVSDVVAELDAAAAAGLDAVLCVRGRDGRLPQSHGHPTITTFDDILD
jgi:enolase-phosphatase E1